MMLRDSGEKQKKQTKNTIIFFAHAHFCSKFIMRHKTTVVIDLEFVAKGKKE
jgi:hypothetical protein